MQTATEWVVTYTIEPVNGRYCHQTAEFFRGTRDECLRLAKAFAGGEDDRHRAKAWQVNIERADFWDELFEDAHANIAKPAD
jgi:hypothetical protein